MNSNPTYYKREQLSGNRTAFMFDDLQSYDRFINETEQFVFANAPTGNAATALNRINAPNYVQSNASNVSWYGTTDANLVRGNLDSYLFNNDLQSFLETFRNNTVNVDVIDIDQQKAIKFTEKEIGIFSFDLASLGLIRVFEYYSPLLKRIISPNLVISQKNEQGQLIFYHIYMPYIPEHKVEYDVNKGGYYSEVLKRVVAKDSLIEIITGRDIYLAYPETPEIPQHIVEQRQQVDENGRKKFSSTFKRSFIEIPKIEKNLPRIDIIVAASYSAGINAQTQMIYSSMAAIAIAEKLSKSGVNYRIIASYPVETSGSGRTKKVFSYVVVKKEGEPFDKNKIAILLSDARQFRYRQFKGFLATQFDAGYDDNISASGIGAAIYSDTEVKDAYMDYLRKQDNPEDKKAAENPRSKIVFNGALTQQDAINQYNRVIQEISRV